MSINFSGLATGLDTATMVDQLVAIEKIPANRLAERKSDAGRRQAIVSDIITKLTALKTARTQLDSPSEIRSITASSNDPTVAVTGSGAAQPGQLTIRVGSLARAQTSVSTTFASATDAIGGDGGTLGIKLGAADEVPIVFTGSDTLTTIAKRINDQMDGVRADVIDNGTGTFQLAVTAEETGVANAITFSEAGQALGFLAEGSTKVAAADATFTMNGIAMTRGTNTVSDAVAGLTLSLTGTHAVTDEGAVVSVARDPAAVETKVKSLVDAFNAVASHVSSQLAYSGVPKGGNTLFGDSTVRALQRDLSGIVNQSYPHGEGTTSLAELGIRLDRNGVLSIDSARFSAAMAKDPTALESVLTGAEGFGAAVDQLVKSYTQAGDGFLSAKKASLAKEMSRYDVEIERIETRASRMGDQLTAQFSKLEQLISSMQSQSAALTKVFG